MERATELLLAICGGEAGEIVTAKSTDTLPVRDTVTLRRHKLDGLLGHHIDNSDVDAILTRLGCAVTTSEQGWEATAPSWRFDIAIEQDLIEEVGRIYGYDNIPTRAPKAALTMREYKEAAMPLKRVRDLLVDRGFHEAITYSFVEPKQQALIVPNVAPLILPSPISADMSAMRLSLLPGLLNTVAYNQKRQQPRVRLFEFGLRFTPEGDMSGDIRQENIRQERMLAGVIAGAGSEEHWDLTSTTVDFF